MSFGSKYQKMLSAYKKLPAERLYIAVLEYFLEDDAKDTVLGDFISFFTEEYNVFSEILFESTVKRLVGSIMLSKKLVSDKIYKEKIEHYLRFLAYIQNIIEMTTKGGVFIVDEMSARLHPLLTKLIVDIFCSTQNEKAQLIFTTHDISLLNYNQFRRDEIVFVDKNERGESILYALSDLKVREDATFSKDYLQGKYGAIPIFNYDKIMGGELNEQFYAGDTT